MTQGAGDRPFLPEDWAQVRLVGFDVDGTLYSQRALRPRMAFEMALEGLRQRSLQAVSVVRHYRRLRERLGDGRTFGFEALLLAQTAGAAACSEPRAREIVAHWLEQRPLAHLARCRYPGLVELFAGLRRHGKVLGVVSDYPAAAKLAALGLEADCIVSATDPEVAILKPHPRGIERLMARTGVAPEHMLFIGDRAERDGLAARRAGVRCLIRASRPRDGWQTFARFDDALFAPMLAR